MLTGLKDLDFGLVISFAKGNIQAHFRIRYFIVILAWAWHGHRQGMAWLYRRYFGPLE
jgi:hypothetical protein